MNDVEQKLVEVFRASLSLNMSDAEIQSLNRTSNHHWNSMGHLNVILASEEVFQISIPEEQGSAVTSFAGMAQLIQTLRQSR